MNKEQILQGVQELARSQQLSKGELITAYNLGAGITEGTDGSHGSKITIAQVLYIVGALIVLIGIVVLIGQNWQVFSSLGRIVVTLGSAIALYVAATLINTVPSMKRIANAIFGISLVLLSTGLITTFYEAGGRTAVFLDAQLMASLLTFAVAFCSFYLYRRNVFVIFSILAGTWSYYAIIFKLLEHNRMYFEFNIYAYITAFAGLMYLFLGYSFQNAPTERKHLTGWLYGFGIISVLGSMLTVGGIWDVLYVGLVFAAILISVYIRSRAFLWFGAIFLMAYIVKITSKYFTDNLGWALSLVLAGILLIAVGYFTYYISRKYITKTPVQLS